MSYAKLHARVAECRRCPRLVRHLAKQQQQVPEHHNAPVVCWGTRRPMLLIVGLAPGAAGANRTGRGFVGDASAKFLFHSLTHAGFATSSQPDTARLLRARLTNAVKCLPPENRPKGQELTTCRAHLRAELALFWSRKARSPRVVIALGGVAYTATRKALNESFGLAAGSGGFVHGGIEVLSPTLALIASFHPSPLNTQTGRLSQTQLNHCFIAAREFIDQTRT